jgi:hypothetical protein
LEVDSSEENKVNSSELEDGDFIGSDDSIKLTFKGSDAEQSTLVFEQFKAETNSTETF